MGGEAFESVRVLEFTTAAMGPVSGRYFANHGATVVRIESSVHPDMVRLSPPFKPGAPRVNASAFWTQFNTGKLDMSLNLKHPEGQEVARRLVQWCDILIQNFATGVMERLGFSYEELIKINPSLIMIHMTNLGRTGPCARHPGLGQPLQAISGLVHLMGWPDRGPDNPFGAIPDIITPPFAVAALVAALDHRRRTGEGQFIDLSQFEVSCLMLTPQMLDLVLNGHEAIRNGNRDVNGAPHGVYPCLGDDRWCAIAVFADEEWNSFCQVVDENLIHDSRFVTLQARKTHEDELDEIVSRWTMQRTSEDVMHTLQKAGVSAGMVNTPADLFDDPQLKHRQHFHVIDHPEIGPHSVTGEPSAMSVTPANIKRAPLLGEHNELIIRELLHMSEEEYAQLIVSDVLR